MKKLSMRWLVVAAAFLAVIIGGAVSVRSQNYGELRINLVISDSRILLYSGTESGLYIGQKLNVVRNGNIIGVLELVEVRRNYSVARVASKTVNISDMDLLVPEGADIGSMMASTAQVDPTPATGVTTSKDAGTGSVKPIDGSDAAAADTKKADSGSKKDSKKDTKKDSKKDDKADDSKKDDSKKSSKKSRSSKSDDSKDDGSSSKKSSSRKKSSRGSSSDDSKKDDSKKDDAKKDDSKDSKKKAAGVPTDPRDYAFPTDSGFSGLWTIPTSDILEKGRAAFSYFAGKYDSSSTHQKSNYWGTVGLSQNLSAESNAFSLTYGVQKNLEFSYGQKDMSITYNATSSGYPTNVSVTTNADSDMQYYGVKFSPKKHFLLDETTTKRWTYALGASRILSDYSDGTYVFGVVSMHYDKFDAHAGIFYQNMEGAEGDETGTMVGVELPVSSKSVLMAEGTLFHAEYTYNFAFRHVLQERAQLLLGISDATELQVKQFGLSYKY